MDAERTFDRLRRADTVRRPVMTIVGAMIVAAIAGCVLRWTVVVLPADVQVLHAVNFWHTPVTDAVARATDLALSPLGSAIIWLGALVVVALLRRTIRAVVLFALVSGVPWALSPLIKEFVSRPRPDQSLLEHVILAPPESWSYPSGHTAFAASLAAAVVLTSSPGARRTALVAASTVAVLLVGWSRVALGMHYPSDVIASMILMPTAAKALHEIWTEIAGWRTPAADPEEETSGNEWRRWTPEESG